MKNPKTIKTVYVDPQLVNMARMKDPEFNFSQFVEQSLEIFIDVERQNVSEEEIRNRRVLADEVDNLKRMLMEKTQQINDIDKKKREKDKHVIKRIVFDRSETRGS